MTLPGFQIVLRQGPIGHVHGRLGDAIHVDQLWLLIAVSFKPRPQTLHLQRLTTEDDIAQSQTPSDLQFLRPESVGEKPRASGSAPSPVPWRGARRTLRVIGSPGRARRPLDRHRAARPRSPTRRNRRHESEKASTHRYASNPYQCLSRGEQSRDVSMRNHRAFGFARSARSIDYIGEVVRLGGRCQVVLVTVLHRPGQQILDEKHIRFGFWQFAREAALGDQDGNFRIVEHESQALGRISQVDRADKLHPP